GGSDPRGAGGAWVRGEGRARRRRHGAVLVKKSFSRSFAGQPIQGTFWGDGRWLTVDSCGAVRGMQPLDDRVLARYATSLAQMSRAADVAQLAEQLICNQQVASSILAVSSVGLWMQRRRPWCCASGGVPKWLNGADCKSAGYGLRRF